MRTGLSLRGRLTLAVACVLALVLSAFSVVLDAAFRAALRRQFDARLAEDANAVAGMVEQHGPSVWELEPVTLSGFEAGRAGAYFEIWSETGAVIGRSPSLGASDLPRLPPSSSGVTAAVTLPNGRPGRLFQQALLPRWEGSGTSAVGAVTVAVERGTEEIDAALARVRLLLWGSGLAAMALAALAGALAIQRGLRPVGRLLTDIDAIDARRLGERLPIGALPAELRPAIVKLNDLLSRLQASFERERRFGADASHELRTPLAGIQSILEVALSRPRGAADYRAALEEALAVTRQMSGLVESLLVLARLDASEDPPRREPVALRELVEECLAAHAPRARERRLAVVNTVGAEEWPISDRERLRIVILNLVANAVAYAEEGGRVVVESAPDRGLLLEVRNTGPAIPAEALERIFDRFFRLDPSRSGGEHWGIGLALVRAVCESLGLGVTAENRAGSWVAFCVSLTGTACVEQSRRSRPRPGASAYGPP
jgi:signal transduction histidine kinase